MTPLPHAEPAGPVNVKRVRAFLRRRRRHSLIVWMNEKNRRVRRKPRTPDGKVHYCVDPHSTRLPSAPAEENR
jgi:hypothetical protein